MNDFKKTDEKEISAVRAVEKLSAGEKRRSFLKKAGVTSLVLSLPSQSVWGASCTVSGNMSGNLSNPNQTNCSVTGKSPSHWRSIISQQNHGLHNPRWKELFTRQPFYTPSDENYDDKRLRRILRNTDPANEFNCCMIAAYFNALYGYYPLTSGISAQKYVDDLCTEAHSSSLKKQQIGQALLQTWS